MIRPGSAGKLRSFFSLLHRSRFSHVHMFFLQTFSTSTRFGHFFTAFVNVDSNSLFSRPTLMIFLRIILFSIFSKCAQSSTPRKHRSKEYRGVRAAHTTAAPLANNCELPRSVIEYFLRSIILGHFAGDEPEASRPPRSVRRRHEARLVEARIGRGGWEEEEKSDHRPSAAIRGVERGSSQCHG